MMLSSCLARVLVDFEQPVFDSDFLPIGPGTFPGSFERLRFSYDSNGNLVYVNGALDKILFDGGFIRNGEYYFFATDHLGSIRTVSDSQGNIFKICGMLKMNGIFHTKLTSMKRLVLLYIIFLFAVPCAAQIFEKSRKISFTLREFEIQDTCFREKFKKHILDFNQANNKLTDDGKTYLFDHIKMFLRKEDGHYYLYMHMSPLWDKMEDQTGYVVVDGITVLFGIFCPDPHWFTVADGFRNFSYIYDYVLIHDEFGDWTMPQADDVFPAVYEVFVYEDEEIRACPNKEDFYAKWWRWSTDGSINEYSNKIKNDSCIY